MKNQQNYEDRTDEMHCLEPPSLLTHLLVKSNIPVEVEKISKDQFMTVFKRLNETAGITFLEDADALGIFHYLDEDGDNLISHHKFETLMSSFSGLLSFSEKAC